MPNEPQYLTIASDLRRRIAAGEFAVGSVIPGRVELAEEYGVAKQTATNAIRVLEVAGLVRPVRKLGTVVLDRGRVTLRRPAADGDGLDHGGDWVDLVDPTPIEGLLPAEISVLTKAGRFGESETFIATRHVLGRAGGVAERLLDRYRTDVEARDWSDVVSIALANAEQARHLGVRANSPLLRILAEGTDAHGRVVAIDDLLLPQRYELRYSVHGSDCRNS